MVPTTVDMALAEMATIRLFRTTRMRRSGFSVKAASKAAFAGANPSRVRYQSSVKPSQIAILMALELKE